MNGDSEFTKIEPARKPKVRELRLTKFFVAAILLASLSPALGQTSSPASLEGTLAKLRNDASKDRDSFLAAESSCEKLLEMYQGKPDEGKILIALTFLEANSSWRDPAKMKAYAERAVEYPADSPIKMQVYIYFGNALRLSRSARSATLVPYLKAFEIAQGEKLPNEIPSLPPAPKFDIDENDPSYPTLAKANADALAARAKAQRVREVFRLRDTVIQQIFELYGGDRQGLDSLRTDVGKDLQAKDYEDLSSRLVSRESRRATTAPK